MAMTAWETYVEDRLVEACDERMRKVKDGSISAFFKSKLADEIKRLNNPAYGKTIELFHDYAGVNLKKKWHWNNHEPKIVRDKLDGYVKLRGDVVHRSRAATTGASDGHPVRRDELEKAITFLKALVAATEGAFSKPDGQ